MLTQLMFKIIFLNNFIKHLMSNQIVEKTQLQHVLTRPEMYAGDMGTVTDKNIVVYNGKTLELRPKLTYSLALSGFSSKICLVWTG